MITIKDLILIRKKYNFLIGEVFDKSIKSLLPDINIKLQKNLDYDWMLKEQSNKIKEQLYVVTKRTREFSKLAQYNKQIMNRLMDLKSTLKTQQKTIDFLREKHYREIYQDYLLIFENLIEKIIQNISSSEYSNKLRKVFLKTEKKFINTCLNWKEDKKQYYEKIVDGSKIINDSCFELDMLMHNYLNSSKIEKENKKSYFYKILISKTINITHYVENFKLEFPKVAKYNDHSLEKINPKTDLFFLNNFDIRDIDSFNDKEYSKIDLLLIEKSINNIKEAFFDINNKAKIILRKILTEKKKVASLGLNEKKTIKNMIVKFLEEENSTTFYIFSQYIEDHELKNSI